nr:hypothetical protein CFP56_37162 [Quercus suber]
MLTAPSQLTIIDSTLLQKAFDTEIRTDHAKFVNLTGYANETIPNTGRVSTRSSDPGLLAKNFNDDLKVWAQGGGVLPNSYAGCDGLCYLHVPGAGFEFDCTAANVTSINYGNQTMAATAALSTNACSSPNSKLCLNATAGYEPTLFSLTFDAQYYDGPYGYITMNIIYTNATDAASTSGSCPGKLYQQTCKLRPAVVNYPVKIEAYKDAHATSSMSLAVDPATFDNTTFGTFNSSGKQQNYFDILRYEDVVESHITVADDSRTRLGGVAQGLAMYLGGNTTMTYSGAGGFYLYQGGNAPAYLSNDLGVQEGQGSTSQFCGFQYYDPLTPQPNIVGSVADPSYRYTVPSVIGKINQIMFALALDVSNEDDDKDVLAGSLSRNATVYIDTIHYVREAGYMWGAFASIIVCVLCVLPVYWGYWQLGRAVTLGPFEIAAAFRAPNLYHPSNAPIDQLIKDPEVGERAVKYGAIVGGAAQGKIGVAEPEVVSRIHPSAKAAAIRESWRTSRIGSGFLGAKSSPPTSPGAV